MWIFPNNSIFIKSSFTLKLDFLKIEFQSKGILLDSFRIEAFCYIFWAEGENAHFGRVCSCREYSKVEAKQKLLDYFK